MNTLVYPEISWAAKLFLIALRTPGLRDYLVSPKGIVAAMKFGVVHKDRLDREALTPYTAPFQDAPARQALIKAGSGLGTKGLAEIARKLPAPTTVDGCAYAQSCAQSAAPQRQSPRTGPQAAVLVCSSVVRMRARAFFPTRDAGGALF